MLIKCNHIVNLQVCYMKIQKMRVMSLDSVNNESKCVYIILLLLCQFYIFICLNLFNDLLTFSSCQ